MRKRYEVTNTRLTVEHVEGHYWQVRDRGNSIAIIYLSDEPSIKTYPHVKLEDIKLVFEAIAEITSQESRNNAVAVQ